MIKIFPSKVHVLSYESTEVQLRVQRCTCTSGNTFESTFVRIVRKYFRTSLQCTSGSTFVLHYSIWRYVFCNTFEGTVQLFNASTVHVQLVSPLRNSKKTSKKTYVYVYWYSWQKTKKNTYKRVRASTLARNLSPSSNEITKDFFMHHRVPGINAELPTPGILRSCSLPRKGYANVANRDFGQDLRFFRDA
jgi:hypothetical protein